MGTLQACIEALNNGEIGVPELLDIIAQMEATMTVQNKALELAAERIAMAEAKAQKAEDVLYAVTHGEWRTRTMSKEEMQANEYSCK